MKLSDYQFSYNAAAYFAARERFGGAERAQLEALNAATDDEGKKTAEYQAEVNRLQAQIDQKELVALISTPTQEGFEALCWAVAELATQGELWRRHMGHEPQTPLTPERVQVELQPYQIPEARALLMAAIVHGIRPPQEESDEVDEVLEELQKKTESR